MAFCDGQLLPISQNTALFSLLGTYYGGDGKSTFALPDMQGNACMQPGQGQGLSLRDLGEIGGSETVTLLTSEIPLHTHTLQGFSLAGTLFGPDANGLSVLTRSAGGAVYKHHHQQLCYDGSPGACGPPAEAFRTTTCSRI